MPPESFPRPRPVFRPTSTGPLVPHEPHKPLTGCSKRAREKRRLGGQKREKTERKKKSAKKKERKKKEKKVKKTDSGYVILPGNCARFFVQIFAVLPKKAFNPL